MNLTWLQQLRKLFNSAALGCCVNYAQVLSKQNESVMQVHDPWMKSVVHFRWRRIFSLGGSDSKSSKSCEARTLRLLSRHGQPILTHVVENIDMFPKHHVIT